MSITQDLKQKFKIIEEAVNCKYLGIDLFQQESEY